MTDTITENEPTELLDVKSEKPRGDCTGCGFNYQLSTCRKGALKGQLIIRKHLSRTGPGLCSGAGELPKGAAPEPEAEHCTEGGCTGCCGCSQMCTTDPCGQAPIPVTTQAPDAFTAPAHVHVFNDWDETGKYCACGAEEDDPEEFDNDSDAFTGPTPHSMSDAIAAVGTVVGIDPAGASAEQLAEAGRIGETVMAIHTAQVPMISTPSPAMVTVPVSGMVAKSGEDQFTAPGPASDIPEGSVSMQPEPERDRWQRYMILGQPHTRTTTFVKSASSTFTLNQWQQRMTVKGLTLRPDLLALAHGLDVKTDKQQLNSIAEQAKEAAGQKVAANLGSAYHAFSERLDAGLITLADIPAVYRHRLEQYQDVIRRAGLTTRPEWIERTTAVRADQVSAALPVAGMLDRIWQLPNGELVIGDLKTGSDLSYGWGEITAQLAVYAHGVNTHGLFDWNTKTWGPVVPPGTAAGLSMQVRTDFAIVMHLPADGDGCTLYRVDLVAGWRRAQICGHVMALNKEQNLALPITVPDVVREEAPAVAEPVKELPPGQYEWDRAVSLFNAVNTRDEAAQLFNHAQSSGKFTEEQVRQLGVIGLQRLTSLGL